MGMTGTPKVDEGTVEQQNMAVQKFLAMVVSYKRFGMKLEFVQGANGAYQIQSTSGNALLKYDTLEDVERTFKVLLALGGATAVRMETLLGLAEKLLGSGKCLERLNHKPWHAYMQGVCELVAECESYNRVTDKPLQERAQDVANLIGIERKIYV